MTLVALLITTRKPGFKQGSSFRLFFFFAAILGALSTASVAVAQSADRPWMNPGLAPEERAELVLKQLTLDEKPALLHGNGMAHAPQWQMPLTVKNTGKRAGTEIAEAYARLPKGADDPYKRLAGWKRVTLVPGESQSITITIDDRALQIFDEEKNVWNMTKGEYQVMVGGSSDDTPLLASLEVR
jgi:hypothetical protein